MPVTVKVERQRRHSAHSGAQLGVSSEKCTAGMPSTVTKSVPGDQRCARLDPRRDAFGIRDRHVGVELRRPGGHAGLVGGDRDSTRARRSGWTAGSPSAQLGLALDRAVGAGPRRAVGSPRNSTSCPSMTPVLSQLYSNETGRCTGGLSGSKHLPIAKTVPFCSTGSAGGGGRRAEEWRRATAERARIAKLGASSARMQLSGRTARPSAPAGPPCRCRGGGARRRRASRAARRSGPASSATWARNSVSVGGGGPGATTTRRPPAGPAVRRPRRTPRSRPPRGGSPTPLSTSCGNTVSPPVLIASSTRPRTRSTPESSTAPMSSVRNQPGSANGSGSTGLR